MNTVLLYFISALFSISQTDVSLTTRTYKFEHSSKNNEKLTDYIQLTFKDNSIIKGTYYGNEDDYHFISDIKFDTNSTNEDARFTLINYRFCKENANPFKEAGFYKIEKVPFELGHEEGTTFMGTISSEQLKLNRFFWFYDSRFDKMLFTLAKEE